MLGVMRSMAQGQLSHVKVEIDLRSVTGRVDVIADEIVTSIVDIVGVTRRPPVVRSPAAAHSYLVVAAVRQPFDEGGPRRIVGGRHELVSPPGATVARVDPDTHDGRAGGALRRA